MIPNTKKIGNHLPSVPPRSIGSTSEPEYATQWARERSTGKPEKSKMARKKPFMITKALAVTAARICFDEVDASLPRKAGRTVEVLPLEGRMFFLPHGLRPLPSPDDLHIVTSDLLIRREYAHFFNLGLCH